MLIKDKTYFFLKIFIFCRNVLATFCTVVALKRTLYLTFTFKMIDFTPIVVVTIKTIINCVHMHSFILKCEKYLFSRAGRRK